MSHQFNPLREEMDEDVETQDKKFKSLSISPGENKKSSLNQIRWRYYSFYISTGTICLALGITLGIVFGTNNKTSTFNEAQPAISSSIPSYSPVQISPFINTTSKSDIPTISNFFTPTQTPSLQLKFPSTPTSIISFETSLPTPSPTKLVNSNLSYNCDNSTKWFLGQLGDSCDKACKAQQNRSCTISNSQPCMSGILTEKSLEIIASYVGFNCKKISDEWFGLPYRPDVDSSGNCFFNSMVTTSTCSSTSASYWLVGLRRRFCFCE